MKSEKLEGIYEGLKLALKIIKQYGRYDSVDIIEEHLKLLDQHTNKS